ncbi:hypothetical protein C8J56DRAFT_454931 [Mycena floridula]|nr:hypothetical protein C8J56DRAFT_454931 [Mycena floridula]
MSRSSNKPRSLSYPETVHLFNDGSPGVSDDLREACQALGQTMTTILSQFQSISAQLHTLDLRGFTAPLRPRWNIILQSFIDLVQQFRFNASLISGRLTMFCSLILPRTSNGGPSNSRSQSEKVQVLRSFMSISAEHARSTWSLAENAVRFMGSLNAFHTEFAKFVSHRATSGQRELRDLASKFGQVEATIKQLYFAIGKQTGADVTFLVYSSLRLIAAVRKRPANGALSYHRLTISTSATTPIANLYEQLDRNQNEMTHAHYAVQVSHRTTDVLTSSILTISTLISEEMLILEASLSFFLTIWSRLQSDCLAVHQWLQDPRSCEIPPCVAAYFESRKTIYGSITESVDLFISGLDPSRFSAPVH